MSLPDVVRSLLTRRMGAPPPSPPYGRKVLLPPLDREELGQLLYGLHVCAAEAGQWDHTTAYLERVLKRAIRETGGEP
jgi:hypothetical protein